MSSKKTIVLALKGQWGYQTDYSMYAKYLSEQYLVKILSVDLGLQKVENPKEKVTVTSAPSASKVQRTRKLLHAISGELSLGNQVLCKYFPGVFLLRFHPRHRNVILDFRTVSVSTQWIKRICEDQIAVLESKFFKRINVVHSSVARKYRLAHANVVPLGAEEVPHQEPPMPRVGGATKFIYVGALAGRHLEILIKAFEIVSAKLKAELHVVGDGYGLSTLQAEVRGRNLETVVEFHGRISHGPKLSNLISSSDWGIVHVPPTKYYAGQPSTKMFEYFSHGLPVLCTNYPAGIEFMAENLGYVYDFNPESLAEAMVQAAGTSQLFDRQQIRLSGKSYLWENIVESKLLPTLKQ